jgi:hypothetical protein
MDDIRLEQIKNYIEDIKEYSQKEDLSINQKQHMSRAITEYKNLCNEAERGRIDIDELHENITSFLYMLQ